MVSWNIKNCLNGKLSSGFVWRLPNSIIGPQVARQRITYTIPQTKTKKFKSGKALRISRYCDLFPGK